MKFSHRNLIIFSGLVWLAVGVFLLNIGLKMLVEPLMDVSKVRNELFLTSLGQMVGGEGSSSYFFNRTCSFCGLFQGKICLGQVSASGCKAHIKLSQPNAFSARV